VGIGGVGLPSSIAWFFANWKWIAVALVASLTAGVYFLARFLGG
jgi:hypothetical protein